LRTPSCSGACADSLKIDHVYDGLFEACKCFEDVDLNREIETVGIDNFEMLVAS
jgi:hypothetical protein